MHSVVEPEPWKIPCIGWSLLKQATVTKAPSEALGLCCEKPGAARKVATASFLQKSCRRRKSSVLTEHCAGRLLGES